MDMAGIQPNIRMTETVVTKNNHTLKAFKDDLITQKIKKRGIYEGLPLSLVARILQKIGNAVVLDIGANIGNHALSFSLDAARVYAFEPVKATFNLLKENIERNCVDNVICFNYGLSDTDTSAEIFVDETGNIGGSSLEYKGNKSCPEVIQLACGDSWVESLADTINKIDLVKIDVEGHEPKALKGLKNTLLKFRPLVMLEYNDEANIKAFKKMNIFDSYFPDYQIFVLGNSFDPEYYEQGSLAKVRRFVARTVTRKSVKLYAFDPSRLYHNLLLVPKEKVSFLAEKDLK